MKKGNWYQVKVMLFSYLAISKILYWFNTVLSLSQSDLDNIGRVVLSRFVSQDLFIILVLVVFHYYEKLMSKKKQKYNKILEHFIIYAIGYVVFVAIIYTYIWILSWFVQITVGSWANLIVYSFASYVVINLILGIKNYLKVKENETYVYGIQTNSEEKNLIMLKTLFDNGVLDEEEYEAKRKKLLSK